MEPLAPTELIRLPAEVMLTLQRFNPWWKGKPGPQIPATRRHLVNRIHRRLVARLAPIVAVRGARQVGKTTSQLQVLYDLLERGIDGRRILRVQFDELPNLAALANPIHRIVEWFESAVLGATLNEAARDGGTFLFFDEVQNLPSWAPQLKSLVDSSTTQVLITGSSALRIELGHDSLSGRVSTLEAGVLSLTEIAAIRGISLGQPELGDNGLTRLLDRGFWEGLAIRGREQRVERDEAFHFFSERGGYPICHARPNVPWPELADQLNENVVKRVIQHDLRVGERGRKRDRALLEELFRLVCRYAGQTPTIASLGDEARQALGANLGDQRIRAYLKFLADTLLVRLIEPLEIRLKRRRGSPKLCLVDHGIRASWLHEAVPLEPEGLRQQPDLGTVAGRLAESIVGSTLAAITGLDLNYLPERKEKGARAGETEIDFVITVGTHRIPIEVKYQSTLDPVRDVGNLRRFLANKVNHAPFGILVTREDTTLDFGPGIVPLPLPSLMLMQ